MGFRARWSVVVENEPAIEDGDLDPVAELSGQLQHLPGADDIDVHGPALPHVRPVEDVAGIACRTGGCLGGAVIFEDLGSGDPVDGDLHAVVGLARGRGQQIHARVGGDGEIAAAIGVDGHQVADQGVAVGHRRVDADQMHGGDPGDAVIGRVDHRQNLAPSASHEGVDLGLIVAGEQQLILDEVGLHAVRIDQGCQRAWVGVAVDRW